MAIPTLPSQIRVRNSTPSQSGLRILRGLALLVMLVCVSIFIWSLVLFPATAETNLNFIRPGNNWTDEVLRAAIADTGSTVGTLAYLQLVSILFPAFFYLVVAGIIFVRRSNDWFSIYLSVLFVVFGTVANTLSRLVGNLHPALGIIISGLGNGGWIGLFPIFYLFPDGKFVPRWTRWMLVLWLGFIVLTLLDTVGFTKRLSEVAGSNLLDVIGIPIALLMFITAALSQVYRYRKHANALQRQQTKWVLGAIILFVASVVLSLGRIGLTQPAQAFTANDVRIEIGADFLFAVVGAFFPISIGIAILRYRLFDIDIIIRRTVTYSLLTAILGAVYFGMVIVTQQLFRAVTGQNSELAIIVSTLAIAILFVPLRRRLQNFLDRRFYRRKYDAQQVLAQFAQTARDETDLNKLTDELIRVVDETMQPERVSVWLKKTGKGK